MSTFKTKFQVLLAKIEGTYGSDASPSASTDAKQVSDLKVNYNSEPEEIDEHRDHLSQVAPIPSKRFAEITFTVYLKGSGTKGSVPMIGDLFKACAFAETISAGSSVVYKPASADHSSITLYRYRLLDSSSAVLEKFVGCRGTFSKEFEAGKIVKVNFTFRGALAGVTDVAAPDPTYGETTKPPILQDAGFTLNSVSLKVQKMSIDVANEVVEDEDFNAEAAGLSGFIITGRKPAGSFNPDVVQVATYDFWSDWEDVQERSLAMTVGATDGNIIDIAAPRVSLDSLGDEDLNGKSKINVPVRFNANAGDDELVFTFR